MINRHSGSDGSKKARITGSLVVAVAVGVVCVPLSSAASAQSAPPSTVAAGSQILASSSDLNLPAWPVLYRGNNAAWPVTVRSLQYLLNSHGARLEVDGVFGQQTETAVRTFQRDRGLVVDGVVGEQTWSALITTVRFGSVGPAVKAIQEQSAYRHLWAEGYPPLEVDGVYGVFTEEWVLRFQYIVSFSEPVGNDGIVGPLTWRALIGGALAE